MLRFINSDY